MTLPELSECYLRVFDVKLVQNTHATLYVIYSWYGVSNTFMLTRKVHIQTFEHVIFQ